MATPFLRSVADYIYEHHKDKVEKLCIVVPNKRAALFLKQHLAAAFSKSIWLPKIISAEELIAELSQLTVLEEIDLLCHLYESYKVCYGADAESFDSFAKWGQLILQDFNEIDRYLADSEQLYENLKDIKVIENWSLGAEELSEYQKNYLKFMNSLGAIYKHFSAFLLSNNCAYQGLAYKQAVLNLQHNNFADQFHKLLFCGFNALNAAELKIIDLYFKQKKAELLWDADAYYLNDKNQEAGMFLRKNFERFPEKEHSFIANILSQKKDIKIVSVPKQIGQAQVVKQTLQKLIDQNIPLDKVAVVLANEKLLWPVLTQLPASVEHINITMEYPLRYTSTYSFIELLIQIQINFEKQKRKYKTVYHTDFISLLRHPLFVHYLKGKNVNIQPSKTINIVNSRNLSFISQNHLAEIWEANYEVMKPLLSENSVNHFCTVIIDFILTNITYISSQKTTTQNSLELEYLHIVMKNFNRLSEVLTKYPHFNDMQSFRQLFTQVVGNASAPFIGEPLRGLQMMGVLETRTLDFDHVILVSANEGVLPSGKSVNSFIPNDLKRAFGLPLYLEKDAIYAYHFYRLLQRASDITITYDSETDAFGKGEKSRFVTQLQLELQEKCPDILITEEVASYPDFPIELDNTINIKKDKVILNPIIKKASSNDEYGGLSPSGLISYKECALKFYFRYGAKLKEITEVEENAEANTFGSILHLALEKLYVSFTGKIIKTEDLKEKLGLVEETVEASFRSFFDNAAPSGKSILQQEVIKVYVKKLVHHDLKFIKNLSGQNQFLSLIALEKEYSSPLNIQVFGEKVTHFIKGKVDRIDSHDGLVRVIDYKSSVKSSDKFTFKDFENLFDNSDYNKQLQLFIYAWLLYKNNIASPEKLKPCIIPFKVFEDEPNYILGEDKKPLVFSKQILDAFEIRLISFVESIFDTSIPFDQTEDEDIHKYCPYKSICNFVD